jgi:hypothetical protein
LSVEKEQERKLRELHGSLDGAAGKIKENMIRKDRQYFDSGDYMVQKQKGGHPESTAALAKHPLLGHVTKS